MVPVSYIIRGVDSLAVFAAWPDREFKPGTLPVLQR